MAKGGGRQAAPAPSPDEPEPAPLLCGLSGIGLLPAPQQVHSGTNCQWLLATGAVCTTRQPKRCLCRQVREGRTWWQAQHAFGALHLGCLFLAVATLWPLRSCEATPEPQKHNGSWWACGSAARASHLPFPSGRLPWSAGCKRGAFCRAVQAAVCIDWLPKHLHQPHSQGAPVCAHTWCADRPSPDCWSP